MGFAKEGYPWVIGAALATFLSIYFNHYTGIWYWVLFIPLSIPLMWITGFMIFFFRDPPRSPDADFIPGKSVLSPADGTLCAMQEENGNLALYIEMHASNVHVTRAHIDGTIKKVVRASGNHYPIYLFKKTSGTDTPPIKKNARVNIEMEDAQGRPFLYQMICGFVARRVKPYVKEGQVIKQGEKMGIIQFGSMTKITLPGTKYKMVAKLPQDVFGAQTILCERLD
jgi:phosphatidylserine decarboxylase